MTLGLSLREFARREGVSDTLVRRAVQQGRLKAYADKSLDPALVGTAWREGNVKTTGLSKTANSGANSANTARKNAEGVRSPPKVKIAAGEIPVEAGESVDEAVDRLAKSGQLELVDYAEALRIKENYLALLRRLDYEQKSGELIERSLAEGVLFEEARAARDAWLNFPARIGPMLAADLGLEADRVTEALTAYVHKQIASLGEPDANFTREGD